jgi:hypothetical protein
MCGCMCVVLINLLKTHSKIALRFVAHKNHVLYCIHKSMRGAELPRHLLHRNVGEEIILHPRMGGHCVVPHNGPACYSAKVVENGPACYSAWMRIVVVVLLR